MCKMNILHIIFRLIIFTCKVWKAHLYCDWSFFILLNPYKYTPLRIQFSTLLWCFIELWCFSSRLKIMVESVSIILKKQLIKKIIYYSPEWVSFTHLKKCRHKYKCKNLFLFTLNITKHYWIIDNYQYIWDICMCACLWDLVHFLFLSFYLIRAINIDEHVSRKRYSKYAGVSAVAKFHPVS